MERVGGDGERARDRADQEIEKPEEEINGDEEIARFDDDFATIFGMGFIHELIQF